MKGDDFPQINRDSSKVLVRSLEFTQTNPMVQKTHSNIANSIPSNHHETLVGGFNRTEKCEFLKWDDDVTYPIYGKVKLKSQTTNQNMKHQKKQHFWNLPRYIYIYYGMEI